MSPFPMLCSSLAHSGKRKREKGAVPSQAMCFKPSLEIKLFGVALIDPDLRDVLEPKVPKTRIGDDF